MLDKCVCISVYCHVREHVCVRVCGKINVFNCTLGWMPSLSPEDVWGVLRGMVCCVSQAVVFALLMWIWLSHKQMWTAGYYGWAAIRDLARAALKSSSLCTDWCCQCVCKHVLPICCITMRPAWCRFNQSILFSGCDEEEELGRQRTCKPSGTSCNWWVNRVDLTWRHLWAPGAPGYRISITDRRRKWYEVFLREQPPLQSFPTKQRPQFCM